jgi:hypothetical protein
MLSSKVTYRIEHLCCLNKGLFPLCRLLVTRDRPNEICFQHFEGMFRCYTGVDCKSEVRTQAKENSIKCHAVLATTEAYLVFKYLNTSKSGYLILDEFYHVYDAALCSWSVSRPERDWFHDLGSPWTSFLGRIKRAVSHPAFEYYICEFIF